MSVNPFDDPVEEFDHEFWDKLIEDYASLEMFTWDGRKL